MKSNAWFRMYSEFLTDPKVQMLPETFQRRYIMLLCMRCSNGDVTLQDVTVAFQLRITDDEWAKTKAVLFAKNLIDEDNKPTAWNARQYITDTSGAARVAKHRSKRKEMGLTAIDHIHKDVRREVFETCDNACVYCDSTDDLTLDHIIPTRRGGTNLADNLQVACRVCNSDKRHMTREEYLAWPGRVTLRVTLLKRPQNTDTDTEKKEPPNPQVGELAATRNVRSKLDYSEAFENFWKSYPSPAASSKSVAWKFWAKMTDCERTAAAGAVPAYCAILRAKPDRPACHAATFLSQRRWENVGVATEASAKSNDYWWKDKAKVASMTIDRWRAGIDKFANGKWPIEHLGPWPGHPKCLVPDSLIKDLHLADKYDTAGQAKGEWKKQQDQKHVESAQ